MRVAFQRLFTTSAYSSSFDQNWARIVYGITVLIMVLYAVFAAGGIHPTTQKTILQEAASSPLMALVVIGYYALGIITIWTVRNGRLPLGSTGPVIMVYLAGGLGFIGTGFARPIEGISLAMVVVFAGLLKRTTGLIIATVVALGTFFVGLALRSTIPGMPEAGVNLYDAIATPLGVVAVSGMTFLFLHFVAISRLQSEDEARGTRLKLAQITSDVSQRISSRLNLAEVLDGAVEQILSSYQDIYHAQIFLLDGERRNARLAASTGEVGKLLLARRHSLPLGSQSVIGHVTATGASVVARATEDSDTIHRRNEFLPDTAAEAAFPLRIGGQVIGALDLQSKVAGAFRAEEMPVFQSLADHIAIAIDNARLFDETNRRLEENQQLVQQSKEAAYEVEHLNRRMIAQSWQDYLISDAGTASLSIDFERDTIIPDCEWTPSLEQAMRSSHLVQEERDGAQIVAIPLRVRGQVIGAMEFDLGSEANLTPEDINLLQEVGEQFGLAAETSRLFETTQRMARREAVVNEIASQLEASNSIEMTLNAAARSLKDVLKANRVAIQLGKVPAVGTGEVNP